MLDTETLEKVLPDIISDINHYIATPVYQASCFDKNPGDACKYCSFTEVCDVNGQEETPVGGTSNE